MRVFKNSIDRLLGVFDTNTPAVSDYSEQYTPSQDEYSQETADTEQVLITNDYDLDVFLEQINLDKRRAVTDLNL